MRAWLPHLVLVGLLGLEGLGAALLHRSDDELRSLRAEGSPQEQLDALHCLTNRASGPEPKVRSGSQYGIALARELYESEDARLREYAFSTDVCKFEYPLWQEMMIEQRLPSRGFDAHWWRSYVIYKRKVGGQVVGGSLRLRMQELRWFFDAQRGIAPGGKAIKKHLLDLHHEMQARRVPGGAAQESEAQDTDPRGKQ